MALRILRAAIVGASTLVGKELAEELNGSALASWDLTLLDRGDVNGQITAVGDEALVIQPVTKDSFSGMDVAFFAGDETSAREFWKDAHSAGTSVVDLTGALSRLPNVVVRSPWSASAMPDLATVAVVVPHPAALMLALVEERLRAKFGAARLAATVLEPASEHGSAGVDELHQQTVALLNFQPVKKELYDAQVAFSMQAALGGDAKVNLASLQSKIESQIEVLMDGVPGEVSLQLLQAPVFHGTTVSVWVELPTATEVAVSAAMDGGIVKVDSESPMGNEGVAGLGDVFVSVRAAGADGRSFWLWMAADNLRLAARAAAASAIELLMLRPSAGVN